MSNFVWIRKVKSVAKNPDWSCPELTAHTRIKRIKSGRVANNRNATESGNIVRYS